MLIWADWAEQSSCSWRGGHDRAAQPWREISFDEIGSSPDPTPAVTCHVPRVTCNCVHGPGRRCWRIEITLCHSGAWRLAPEHYPEYVSNPSKYDNEENMAHDGLVFLCTASMHYTMHYAPTTANIRFIEMSWGRIQFNSFALHTQQPFREQLKYKIRKWVQTLNTLHIKVVNT